VGRSNLSLEFLEQLTLGNGDFSALAGDGNGEGSVASGGCRDGGVGGLADFGQKLLALVATEATGFDAQLLKGDTDDLRARSTVSRGQFGEREEKGRGVVVALAVYSRR
jgi:hypothetical protein